MTGTILDVSGLEVSFDIGGEPAVAVDRLGFSLRAGETLGIVGESGSGKSMAALAVMGLIPSPPGSVSGGSIRFRGRELVGMDEEERRRIRGKDIAMIFQEPMTALNPVFTVGDQIAETLMLHEGLERRAAWEKAAELLAEVGIPEPAIRVRNYPFELSGGMRQRVMIAIALACRPAVLIADELAAECDFFSIGTNDLTQYTCALDRQNAKLEPFFNPHHPAVLRAIKMTIEAGHRHGIWVGICGELGADTALTETFLRMGVDELSMNAKSILPVRKIIRSVDLSKPSEKA